ncbi:MAG: HD domain-containing protein [Candidatus Magnetominusculus sp. LBB02]|nr:HD domain-containing protein [Candidatus Magnetominusculus sp. LBB02]
MITYMADELEVGVPITNPVFDIDGRLLLSPGYVIKDAYELYRVRRQMGHTPVKIAEGPHNRPDRVTDIQRSNPFETFRLIQKRMDGLLFAENNGDVDFADDFPKRVDELCGLIQELCDEDEDIALGAAFLDKDMRYAIQHPIHVAVICEIIAKDMEYSQEDRKQILAAALTMNISMLELQEELHSQSTPLSKDQKLIISGHPIADVRLLQKLGVADEVWLTAVLQHHESIDGSGYPHNIRGSDITVQSQIISLTDAYTAMTSSRAWRATVPANEAMQKIFMSNTQKLTSVSGGLFVRNLGIYPPGTVVRLQNGEIAVVKQRGNKIDHPVVQAIITPAGTLYYRPQLRDTENEEFKIVGLLNKKQINFGISNEMIWGYGDDIRSDADERRHQRLPISDPTESAAQRTRNEREEIESRCWADISTEGNDPVRVAVLNISISGCRLQIPSESLCNALKGDRPCHLSLIVRDIPLITGIKFIIKNVTNADHGCLVGIEFVNMPDKHRIKIEAYLESLNKQ